MDHHSRRRMYGEKWITPRQDPLIVPVWRNYMREFLISSMLRFGMSKFVLAAVPCESPHKPYLPGKDAPNHRRVSSTGVHWPLQERALFGHQHFRWTARKVTKTSNDCQISERMAQNCSSKQLYLYLGIRRLKPLATLCRRGIFPL